MTLRYAHLAANDLDECAIAADAAGMAAISEPGSRAHSSHSQRSNGTKRTPDAMPGKKEAGVSKSGAQAMPARK